VGRAIQNIHPTGLTLHGLRHLIPMKPPATYFSA